MGGEGLITSVTCSSVQLLIFPERYAMSKLKDLEDWIEF